MAENIDSVVNIFKDENTLSHNIITSASFVFTHAV